MRPPGADCRSPLPPASGCCWLYTCVSSLCLGCCSSPARRYGALCPAPPGSSLPGAPQCRPRRSTGRSLALLLCTPLRWRPLRPAVRAAPLSPSLLPSPQLLAVWGCCLCNCEHAVCVFLSLCVHAWGYLCVCLCNCVCCVCVLSVQVHAWGCLCVCVCVTLCVCVFLSLRVHTGGVCVCVCV